MHKSRYSLARQGSAGGLRADLITVVRDAGVVDRMLEQAVAEQARNGRQWVFETILLPPIAKAVRSRPSLSRLAKSVTERLREVWLHSMTDQAAVTLRSAIGSRG